MHAVNGCLQVMCINQTVQSGISSVHAYHTIEDLLIKSPNPKTVILIPDSNWIPMSRQIIRKRWAHLSLGSKHHRRAVCSLVLHSSLCLADRTSKCFSSSAQLTIIWPNRLCKYFHGNLQSLKRGLRILFIFLLFQDRWLLRRDVKYYF